MKKQTKTLLTVVISLCAVVLISIGFLLYVNTGTYLTKNDYVFYFNGDTTTYNKGIEIDNSEGYVNIDGKSYYGLPFNSDEDILLTGDSIYYPLSNYEDRYVDNLTTISLDGYHVNFTNGGKTFVGEQGFLYDGKFSYIFLQDTKLTYNGLDVYLSALSSLYCDGFTVSYYDFLNKEGGCDTLYLDNISVTCNSYTVYINESMYDKGIVNMLLYKSGSSLDSMF